MHAHEILVPGARPAVQSLHGALRQEHVVSGFARTRSVALVGLDGHVVDVEADIGQSLPAFSIIGLPDQAVNESR